MREFYNLKAMKVMNNLFFISDKHKIFYISREINISLLCWGTEQLKQLITTF